MTQPEGPGLTLNLTDLSADTEPADYSPVGTDLVGTLAAWERPDPSLRAPPEDLQAPPSLANVLPVNRCAGRKVSRQQKQKQNPRGTSLDALLESQRANKEEPTPIR